MARAEKKTTRPIHPRTPYQRARREGFRFDIDDIYLPQDLIKDPPPRRKNQADSTLESFLYVLDRTQWQFDYQYRLIQTESKPAAPQRPRRPFVPCRALFKKHVFYYVECGCPLDHPVKEKIVGEIEGTLCAIDTWEPPVVFSLTTEIKLKNTKNVLGFCYIFSTILVKGELKEEINNWGDNLVALYLDRKERAAWDWLPDYRWGKYNKIPQSVRNAARHDDWFTRASKTPATSRGGHIGDSAYRQSLYQIFGPKKTSKFQKWRQEQKEHERRAQEKYLGQYKLNDEQSDYCDKLWEEHHQWLTACLHSRFGKDNNRAHGDINIETAENVFSEIARKAELRQEYEGADNQRAFLITIACWRRDDLMRQRHKTIRGEIADSTRTGLFAVESANDDRTPRSEQAFHGGRYEKDSRDSSAYESKARAIKAAVEAFSDKNYGRILNMITNDKAIAAQLSGGPLDNLPKHDFVLPVKQFPEGSGVGTYTAPINKGVHFWDGKQWQPRKPEAEQPEPAATKEAVVV
ncbi:hypothetical protein ACFL02_07865 [Planctomycetota bacterium]